MDYLTFLSILVIFIPPYLMAWSTIRWARNKIDNRPVVHERYMLANAIMSDEVDIAASTPKSVIDQCLAGCVDWADMQITRAEIGRKGQISLFKFARALIKIVDNPSRVIKK